MVLIRRRFFSRPADSTIMWVVPLWIYIVLKMSGTSKFADVFWTLIVLAAIVGWFFANWEILVNKK